MTAAAEPIDRMVAERVASRVVSSLRDSGALIRSVTTGRYTMLVVDRGESRLVVKCKPNLNGLTDWDHFEQHLTHMVTLCEWFNRHLGVMFPFPEMRELGNSVFDHYSDSEEAQVFRSATLFPQGVSDVYALPAHAYALQKLQEFLTEDEVALISF